MKFSDSIAQWLARDPDPVTQAELSALVTAGSEKDLADRFSSRLAFGTAGLRGLIGAGPNRINQLVVLETTLGLARYVINNVPEAAERGVVVGFDGRRCSKTFAHLAARVLQGEGLSVYLSESVVATPVCAFALKKFGAAAGIVVTASHNPPDYNGYKVFWGNGAQIIPPQDVGIAEAIAEVVSQPLPTIPAELDASRVTMFGKSLDDDYLAAVKELTGELSSSTLSLAYTPLHGVGANCVERALENAGFDEVYTVPEQREPDGTFPTVSFPNPEEEGAMDAVLELARTHGAALALANDPDADRLACAVRDSNGDYQMLTGNEIGVLLGIAAIEAALAADKFRPVVATTIVSSRMLGKAAKNLGADYFETLTGFKWIANQAIDLPNPEAFVFGYEEALGYTVGTLVRDKDGISALVALAMQAEKLAAKGKTLLDRLTELYDRHGLFLTAQKSLWLTGDPGRVGEALRENPPEQIGDWKVTGWVDLKSGASHGSSQAPDLPGADVLIYDLEPQARVVVRPSGTEPKLKCYYEVSGNNSKRGEVEAALAALIAAHQAMVSQ